MMIHKTILWISLVCVAGLTGCGWMNFFRKNGQDAKDLQKSAKERSVDIRVSTSELGELVTGNSRFALDLYQELRSKQDNLFFSPYSISVALAMTYAGAADQTEAEMAGTMHYTLDQAKLHSAINGLDLLLNKQAETGGAGDSSGFRLNTANSLWGQKGTNFLDEYLDILAEYYGAGLRTLDFSADPDAARQIINEWVSDETERKIEDLIPPDGIDSLTQLVLVNAIYFKAEWAFPFIKSATQEDSFYPLSGGTEIVQMMHIEDSFLYTAGADYQAVMLPYRDSRIGMLIILPAEGQLDRFEAALTAEKLEEMIAGMRVRRVDLRLPKFRLEQGLSLADTLAAMGMPSAFSPEADFSRMNGTKDLFLRDVIHKAFIAVDEEGTEAAAATAVIALKSMPIQEEAVQMRVDRPFVFMIKDLSSRSILFMGRAGSLDQ